MRHIFFALALVVLFSSLNALTNISSCSDMNTANEVYNLIQSTGCSGACVCMRISADNVTLRCNGFTIDGTDAFFSAGVNASNVRNATIRDCVVTDFYFGIRLETSNFSTIMNNSVSSIADSGIGISVAVDSDNNTVVNNTVLSSRLSGGIGVNGSSNYNFVVNNSVRYAYRAISVDAPYNNLTNNDLRDNDVAVIVYSNSLGTIPCENYIDGSNIAGSAGDPVFFVYDKTGTTIENSASYGEVLLCNVSNSAVRNITMTNDNGIVLSYSSRNQIYNNQVSGGRWTSLFAIGSHNNTVFNNTLAAPQNNVELMSSNDNILCNNTIPASAGSGFYFTSSSSNRICNTPITATASGITFQSGSNYNAVDNVTVNAPISGISIVYAAYNNNITNFTATITSTFGAGIFNTQGASSGNRYADIAIYMTSADPTPFAIDDRDGGETFTNVYLSTASGSFIHSSTATNSYTNLTLARAGSIVNFPGTFTMSTGSSSSNTNIASDFVSIDSSLIPELNQDANITTYVDNCAGAKVYSLSGFPSSRNSILTSGSNCTLCNIISCAGNTIRFDVPAFTGYAAGLTPTYLSFSFSPSQVVVYGTQTNVSCNASNSEVLLNLYRGGTLVSSNYSPVSEVAVLDVGSYLYVCNTTGNVNYSSASNSGTLKVSKATPTLTLSFSPSASVTQGTQTNVSCSPNTGQVGIYLFRDGVQLGYSPADGQPYLEDVGTLALGSYEYVCNTTGGSNYLPGQSSGTLTVTAPGGAAPPMPQLLINAPSEVLVGTEVIITVTRDDGVPLSEVEIVIKLGGSELLTAYTDAWGRVFFTPTSTGIHTITATKSGFRSAEARFDAYAPGEINVHFEPGCKGSIITLSAGGQPVGGAAVAVYRCPAVPDGECIEVLGTYTTNSNGQVSINARDATILIVAGPMLPTFASTVTLFAELPSTEECVECARDSDCPSDYICRDNECVKKEAPPEWRCTSNAQCSAGYECRAGACVLMPRPECTSSNDCLPGYECRDSTCVRKQEVEVEEGGGEGAVEGAEGPSLLQNIASFAVSYSWLILLLLAALLLFFLFWKKKKKKRAKAEKED